MADRLMKVNSFTTLDMVEARAEGHDFEESTLATVNVTTPRGNPEYVRLQVELDNVDLGHLPPHADSVALSPADARALAADLETYADRVADATESEETPQTGGSDDE
ncbi:DUF6360 family protein [Halovenus rubra]|uniref:DUF6360 family protein n=2 Tax=Halovenus rubra TaxID=869890 RepID=A0ABD5X823_9EURY|nr:DUF6360 family protein [Halovenus rubra]